MEDLTTVERTMFVDAPPEAIWKALIDPEITKLYLFNSMVFCNWKRGSAMQWYEMKEGKQVLQAKGVLLAFSPRRRLRYTHYVLNSGLPDDPSSYTTVDIELIVERDGRTRVQLHQGDFAGLPDAVRRAREAGKSWVEALVGLKREAEQEARSIAA